MKTPAGRSIVSSLAHTRDRLLPAWHRRARAITVRILAYQTLPHPPMTTTPAIRSIPAAAAVLRRIILRPLAFFAFVIGSISAQTANTGTIEGRVQNEVTGRFLGNSRVMVKGSDLRVLTDESGSYRITDVPSGPIVLEVFYTGLDPQEISLSVPAGKTVTQDVSLTNQALYGASSKGGVVKLDPFTVDAAKVTDQASIAINEQRFAPNIKNIVAVGDVSEQPDGNIGEFLKFMPGVAVAGGGSVPANIYIRGFPPNTTTFTVDGATIASTGFGAPDRTVQTSNQTPGTGMSRLEVTKVPTPATAADTMAGSVNMVTRTAFEANRASFVYQVNLAGVL
ncbi:MAG: carboxypeptidase regulatory-like domain-containing protein, partial [Verrucomicrobia bacterium]|nr:carboxypeptidase regulatory-like domain-containing protein [Verrucomicrobiota bacterium]